MQINCSYTELKDPKLLLPHPKNPNKHKDAQIDRLGVLITYYGFRHPIIVSKNSGFVVAGHGRLMSALKLGLKEVPVDYQEFDTPDSEYSFMVADNAISEWSELDLASINSEMINLGPEFDVNFLGIENFQLNLTDAFEMPEMDKEESEKKFLLEVNLPNELECSDLYDDLISKGYVVRKKTK